MVLTFILTLEMAEKSARDLVQAQKVAEFLISKLPGINDSEEDQFKRLAELESENDLQGEILSKTIEEGNELLNFITRSLLEVSDKQNQLHNDKNITLEFLEDISMS